MWYDETGLPWVAPSPNLKSLDASLLYTGTVFVEGTNLSEGRGTDAPFQLIGAPWLTDAGALARFLGTRALSGVRFDSVSRTITAGQKHGKLTIPMLRISVTARDSVDPVRVGAITLAAIRQRHPQELVWREAFLARLAGGTALHHALVQGIDATEALMKAWRDDAARFERETAVDRLYR